MSWDWNWCTAGGWCDILIGVHFVGFSLIYDFWVYVVFVGGLNSKNVCYKFFIGLSLLVSLVTFNI